MADVALQAGHCFRTSGSTGTRAVSGRPTEQQVAWDICQRAAALLTGHGHKVTVLVADPSSSAAYGGDCFVAVHCDGSISSSARGASVGYRTSEGQSLAHAWKQAYARRGWTGFRPDNYTAGLQGYYGTRSAIAEGNRMACIIEAGFLTNPTDLAQLASSAGRERVALTITDAVNAHHPPTAPHQEDEIVPEVEIIRAFGAWLHRPPSDEELALHTLYAGAHGVPKALLNIARSDEAKARRKS